VEVGGRCGGPAAVFAAEPDLDGVDAEFGGGVECLRAGHGGQAAGQQAISILGRL
jgi:hypothetical protein